MTIRRPTCLLLTLLVPLLGITASAHASPGVEPTRTITPGHAHYPHGGTTSTGQGLSPSNTNAQLAETIPAKVRRSWAASPKGTACPYNGSEDREFATTTTATNGTYTVALQAGPCAVITGYRTKSGKRVWARTFPSALALVSDGTYVYVHTWSVVDSDAVDSIVAIKIKSGKVRWAVRTSDEQEEVVVGSGVVVHGNQVLDAKTGKLRFTIPTGSFNSFEPRTLVADGTLFHNNEDVVDAWTPKGQLLWRYIKTDDPNQAGARELLPQYDAGRLYVRDGSIDEHDTLVLDAKTGAKLPDLPHTALPLALDGHVGIFTTNPYATRETRVSAVDLDDGYVYWTKTYTPANPEATGFLLRTPPVIENGLVWFGLAPDGQAPLRLAALDEATGGTKTEIAEQCRLKGHRSITGQSIGGGTIGVAQHRLFVPVQCGLQSYVAQR